MIIGPGNIPNSDIPGVLTTSQREHYLLRGMAFTQSTVYTFGSAEVNNFIIDPTGYTPDSEQKYGLIYYDIPAMAATGGPLLIEYFSAPAYSDIGTVTVPAVFNRNSLSPRTAQMIITEGATITDPGDAISQLLLPATSVGVNGAPAAIGEALPFVVGSAVKFLMRVTNENGAGVRMQIRQNWFEI